jgi:hypothetical protein
MAGGQGFDLKETGVNNLSDYLATVGHAAASIYHEVASIEPAAQKWVAEHPEIGPLVNDAVKLAAELLGMFGMGGAGVTALHIIAALKALAARDSTLPSVPMITIPVPHTND